MLPGVFTAFEVDMRLRVGAELLKLFPAEPGGPGYLAAMLQPFPEARLVPTGGITAANMAAYLDAGGQRSRWARLSSRRGGSGPRARK